MNIGEICVEVGLAYLNMGLFTGLVLGIAALLRPLLTRLIPARQRGFLWGLIWAMAYLPQLYSLTGRMNFLPVTLRGLLVPRTGGYENIPAYFPVEYDGAGPYHLALPGGRLVEMELNNALVLGLLALWLAGFVVLARYFTKREKALMAVARAGKEVDLSDPILQRVVRPGGEVELVRLSKGLPSSFVRREARKGSRFKGCYVIYLQEGLSPQHLRMVLLHEVQHIRLHHCFYKGWANVGLLMYWWNPLVWLGYRQFCRDLELACDEAVLEQLGAESRREYARALTELGAGRQLWESPLSFGECDAAVRVRAAVAWKPAKTLQNLAGGALTALLFLFLLGGPWVKFLPQDLALTFARSEGGTEAFRQEMGKELGRELDRDPVEVTEIWCREKESSTPGRDGNWSVFYVLVRTAENSWYNVKLDWTGDMAAVWGRDADLLERVPDLTDWDRLA